MKRRNQGKTAFFALVGGLLALPGVVRSAQASTLGMAISESEMESDFRHPRDTGAMTGSLGYDTLGYLYQTDNRSQSIFPSMNVQAKALESGPWLESAAQGEGFFVFTPSRPFYFEMPEAYIGTSSELSPAKITLGRKLESWSKVDEEWELGIWQPRFRRDYIHPDAVGLTGAFLSVERKNVKVEGFASPVFVPERGANVEERDGSIVSDSQWMIPPPSDIPILRRNTAIRYHLDVPPLRQIIFNPSAGGLLRVGASQGPWGQAAYIYKPMNQFLLSYDAYLKFPEQEVQATIHPRVVYHHLASLDGGYNTGRLSLWGAMLVERPVNSGDTVPAGWTSQQYQPATTESVGARWKALNVAVLHQTGGNASDAGQYASGTGSVFDDRYPFQDAVSVGANFPISRRAQGGTKLLLDPAHEGAILSAAVGYSPAADWSVQAGTDLVGSRTNDANFFSRYQANSSIHGGVSYVF